jgi:uncharacterized membrane protein YdjX (TVP38/TMEM64 family)
MARMSDRSAGRASPLRFLPLGVLAVAGVLFLALGGPRYLSLKALAEHHEWLCDFVMEHNVAAPLVFIIVYAALVALSLPAAALLSITSGFFFGLWLGTVCALLGATIGATIVFLAVRAGLTGLIDRAGPRLRRIEAGFREDALSYLLVLRAVPIFPFWLVNLAAGAVGLRLSVYVLATFVGMIPASFIYASLGSGIGDVLAQGHEPDIDIGALCRPSVLLPIIGFAVLVLLPVVYKRWRGARSKQPA